MLSPTFYYEFLLSFKTPLSQMKKPPEGGFGAS